jgi:ABC-type transport system involved in multi-copper enzyme maturation permease subunit
MIRALVLKELRETRLFAALALGLYFVYVSKLTGRWDRLLTPLVGWAPGMSGEKPDVPFVQGNFLSVYVCIGVALAIALGFRQSAWEPNQGTALYLLHLPLSRRAIYLTKLLTGLGLLLLCTLLPVVAYATWAAMPGTHQGPFEWSMTGEAFRSWLLMPLAYLGAFASGIRPARWIGSRLFPLVGAAIPALFAFIVPFWWLVAVPSLLLVAAMLVSDIFLEAETRDF